MRGQIAKTIPDPRPHLAAAPERLSAYPFWIECHPEPAYAQGNPRWRADRPLAQACRAASLSRDPAGVADGVST
jgi:hypothetical protein